MSTAMWKLDKDLCRCCHAEGAFKHLSDPCFQLGQEEIYSDMLQDCLDVKIVPMTGVLSDVTYTICESCVARLRDASNFKRQVQDCEERFKDMYSKNMIKCGNMSPDYEVKEEPMAFESDEPDADMKQEYQSVDEDDEDDDDAFMKFDDEDSLDLEEREELITIQIKGEPKGKGKGKAKPKPKLKKVTPPAKKAKPTKEKPIKVEAEELTEAAVSGEKKKDQPEPQMIACFRCKTIRNIEDIGDTDKCPECDQALTKCLTSDQLAGRRLPRQAKKTQNNGKQTKAARPKRSIPNVTVKNVDDIRDDDDDVADDTDVSIDAAVAQEGAHECTVCKRVFDTEKKLTGHFQRVHGTAQEGDDKHECTECKRVYANKKQLTNHFRRCHRPAVERGSKQSKYQRFIKVVHGEQLKYTCGLCDFESGERAPAMAHIPAAHITQISCPICGEVFSDLQLLQLHKTQPHTNLSYPCKSCELVLPSTNKLLNHYKTKHRQVKCSFCQKMLVKVNLREHLLEQHNELMPTCGVCGLKSMTQSRIERHQRMVHLKEKNVMCPVCKFECFGYQQLKKHMISHKVDKLYECRFCKKTFPRQSTCRIHEMIHTGEKKKVCELCDASFVQKASLNYHMLKHHPDHV